MKSLRHATCIPAIACVILSLSSCATTPIQSQSRTTQTITVTATDAPSSSDAENDVNGEAGSDASGGAGSEVNVEAGSDVNGEAGGGTAGLGAGEAASNGASGSPQGNNGNNGNSENNGNNQGTVAETAPQLTLWVEGVTGTLTADIWAKWETLTVAGRAPRTGYNRDQFGQRWRDIDRNGCDQRNDILQRDLHNPYVPNGCRVLTGTLHDPFTGNIINFERGQDTSQLVQIDHIVPLADAWQKGAQQWTPEQREQFANDPLNLLAVDGHQNQKKSASDAASWQPPNKSFRCHYAAQQITVKHTYNLWVTQAEKEALARELNRCGETIQPS